MSMTPLRQRYSEDLRLRNKSPRTIETYVLRVRQFAEHFGKSPEQLGPDELRAYQQHLVQRQVSWSMFNQSVCALRFLYNVTLRRPHLIAHLPFAKRPRVLPTVLSPEEVTRLLAAALPGRDRTPRHQRRGRKFLATDLATLLNWLRRGDASGSNAHSQSARRPRFSPTRFYPACSAPKSRADQRVLARGARRVES
jgi:site-specific recombinase XerD